MSAWALPGYSEESSPYVVQDSIVNLSYPLGILQVDSLAHLPKVQVVFIAAFDNKILAAVPRSAWNRRLDQRIIPSGWFTKMTPLECVACSLEERDLQVEDLMVQIWIGFLKPSLQDRVDFSSQEDLGAEYVFEADCAGPILPFGQALADVANEHFSFFSAQEEFPQEEVDASPVAEELGLAEVCTRVGRLEHTISQMAANLETLVQPASRPSALRAARTMKSSSAPSLPVASKVKLAPKPKMISAPPSSAEQYPSLDPGVVKAAVQAGLSEDVLQQMSRLVGRNPKAAKMSDLNLGLVPDPLSDQEEEDAQFDGPGDAGALEEPTDPVHAALMKLTDIVQTITEDKRKRMGLSKLDNALEFAGGSSPLEAGGIGTGKRSAAARRALRAMLVEQPAEIHTLIEKLMWEDISSQTLVPGVHAPSFSCRAWVEHRSRITSHRTTAHAAWAVAGALDALINQRPVAARARLAILLMQLDQASIDQGSWVLASELGLEAGPPIAALEHHKPPNTAAARVLIPASWIRDGRRSP